MLTNIPSQSGSTPLASIPNSNQWPHSTWSEVAVEDSVNRAKQAASTAQQGQSLSALYSKTANEMGTAGPDASRKPGGTASNLGRKRLGLESSGSERELKIRKLMLERANKAQQRSENLRQNSVRLSHEEKIEKLTAKLIEAGWQSRTLGTVAENLLEASQTGSTSTFETHAGRNIARFIPKDFNFLVPEKTPFPHKDEIKDLPPNAVLCAKTSGWHYTYEPALKKLVDSMSKNAAKSYLIQPKNRIPNYDRFNAPHFRVWSAGSNGNAGKILHVYFKDGEYIARPVNASMEDIFSPKGE
ncbi:hypothetical protein [Martelella sp. HB161492]|uniref:hypothetical protein n=1 Tax=Martelella sp. HB161492 TaxID=2720726 RepID=UPI0015904779|nr:hypothetical protein [Martelella sp. HB161492]